METLTVAAFVATFKPSAIQKKRGNLWQVTYYKGHRMTGVAYFSLCAMAMAVKREQWGANGKNTAHRRI